MEIFTAFFMVDLHRLPPKQSNSDAFVRFELAPVTPKSLNFSFGFYSGQTVPNEENTYYILESVDQSESITLLDPLNEIEVLFDDTFLSGFQQYSSSKIVFKFSESSIGLTSTSFIFIITILWYSFLPIIMILVRFCFEGKG